MMLWALWKRRNEKVWDGVQRTAREIVNRSQEAIHDWVAVKKSRDTAIDLVVTSNSTCWYPPQNGKVKCNVDAALFQDNNSYGVGLCVRDEKGNFIKAKIFYHSGTPPARKAEALGVLDALRWLRELGLQAVDLELDCKEVVEAIQGEKQFLNEFGPPSPWLTRGCKSAGCSMAMDLTVVEVDCYSTGPLSRVVGFSRVVNDEYEEQIDEGLPNTPSSLVTLLHSHVVAGRGSKGRNCSAPLNSSKRCRLKK
ncbi:Ribonuclease H-like superfamily [Sesbania bispinosa]|nr:Ribonuclease H-like superfamily [Sesbania bispinosa]